jgi:hypothetical protein
VLIRIDPFRRAHGQGDNNSHYVGRLGVCHPISLANPLAKLNNLACRQLFRSIRSWLVDFMEKTSAREVILLGPA